MSELFSECCFPQDFISYGALLIFDFYENVMI